MKSCLEIVSSQRTLDHFLMMNSFKDMKREVPIGIENQSFSKYRDRYVINIILLVINEIFTWTFEQVGYSVDLI